MRQVIYLESWQPYKNLNKLLDTMYYNTKKVEDIKIKSIVVPYGEDNDSTKILRTYYIEVITDYMLNVDVEINHITKEIEKVTIKEMTYGGDVFEI